MKVMIIVTHLLGTGHLSRALVLAKAFDQAGHAVTLVSGGMPVRHLDPGAVDLVQLPPLRSDGVNFTVLLDEHGQPASAGLMKRRSEILAETLEKGAPDILITELFPFGRRVLRDEFKAVLQHAHARAPRPLVVSSVRDILAPPSKPSKAEEAQCILDTYFDAVLVHADDTVASLDASWPVTDALRPFLHYTGFVAEPAPPHHPKRTGEGEILVTAGGGNVGDTLYEAALSAAGADPRTVWRLLVGGTDAAERCAALQAKAPENVIVEPSRRDFRQMLYHAKASVSLCGYNTALDILQAGTPAVFVPFDEGKEIEQTLRARAMASLDGITHLRTADLSGASLLDKVAAVVKAPRRKNAGFHFDGAHRTVEIVSELLLSRAAQ